MILSTEVEMTWIKKTKEHYQNKGYAFTAFYDKFLVKLEDLTASSAVMLTCQCDVCGKVFQRQAFAVIHNALHSCGSKRCKQELIRRTCQERYGQDCTLRVKTIREKGQSTLLARYGVSQPSYSKDIIAKRQKTFQEHFTDLEARKDLQQRKEATRELSTGYKTPFHDPKIRAKSKTTLVVNTGYDNPWKNPDIQCQITPKIMQTKFRNNSLPASQQQKWLCDVLHGVLNYPVDKYAIDIALLDSKTAIEYNGPGYYIHATLHGHTLEQMIEHDKNKIHYLLSLGWKVIVIKDRNDRLMSYYESSDIQAMIASCKSDSALIDLDLKQIHVNVL